MPEKGLLDRALDGCHKWGWIINLLVMILMFAYFVGEMNTGLASAKERLSRIENVLDQMLVNAKAKP